MPLTAQIGELLQDVDAFELIRDQIAAILKVESKNQEDLATAASKDPSLWKLRIFTERSNPWEQYLDATSGQNLEKPKVDLTPIVCVNFSSDAVDERASNIIDRQKYDAVYYIDCFGCGVSRSTSKGHVVGDEECVRNANRAMRLVRKILMSGYYVDLGIPGLVWKRMLSAREIQAVDVGDRPTQHIVCGRLTFGVSFNEISPEVQGQTLESVFLTVKRAETGEIYFTADYTPTA